MYKAKTKKYLDRFIIINNLILQQQSFILFFSFLIVIY